MDEPKKDVALLVAENKKDRQEWKPPNSLNLLCSGTRD